MTTPSLQNAVDPGPVSPPGNLSQLPDDTDDDPTPVVRTGQWGQWLQIEWPTQNDPLGFPPELSGPDLPKSNAGLERAIWVAALRRGYRIEPRPPCPGIRPLAAPAAFTCPEGLYADDKLLPFVREHPHGLIQHGSGCNTAWLIAQIRKGFPHAKIAVVSAARQPIYQLAQQLRGWGIQVTTPSCRYCPPDVARVVAGTYTDMAHNQVGFAQRDIVIALDPSEAQGWHAQNELQALDSRFRLFALLRASRRLSPRQRTAVQVTFSFDRLDIPRHGFEPIEVRTAWSPIKTAMLQHAIDEITLRRKGVWLHRLRNRRIAALARAADAGDLPALQHKFPSVAQALQLQSATTTGPLRTAIIVESVEHGLALAQQMPGWELVAGPHVILDGLSQRQRAMLQGWRVGKKQIITVAALDGVEFTRLDMVIWAGAGGQLPALPMHRLICPAGQSHWLLLVDFADRHHPQLRRWSRQRRDAYADAEWNACGAHPVRVRIDRFMAEQRRMKP